MCQTPLIFFTFWKAALHPDMGTSALKYRACAQNVLGVTTVFSFWDAGLQQDEDSSTLKHRACAQNVSDVTHSSYVYGCCPTHR
jgi:hypothetical protein